MSAVTSSKSLSEYLYPNLEAQLFKVIDRIADGMGLHESCYLYQVPVNTFRYQVIHSPKFKAIYETARDFGIDKRVEDMRWISDNEMNIDRAKLKCSNIRWEAERAFPKKYGGAAGMATMMREGKEDDRFNAGPDDLDAMMQHIDGESVISLPAPPEAGES